MKSGIIELVSMINQNEQTSNAQIDNTLISIELEKQINQDKKYLFGSKFHSIQKYS